jgi:rSAM-associated Gly-rich repeat protein
LNITTRTGLVGFFLALSTLQIPNAGAATSPTEATPDRAQPIESRLSRLTEAIRQRESLLPEAANSPGKMLVAQLWLNGGGGGWGNGAFLNAPPWLNGGFVNGGSWRNRYCFAIKQSRTLALSFPGQSRDLI